MEPDAKEMEVLKAYPGFTNVTENIGVTYHGYWEGDGQCSIDFIIVRGDICCESLTKWTDEEKRKALLASRYLNSVSKGSNALELNVVLMANLDKPVADRKEFHVPQYIVNALTWLLS